MWRQCLQPTAVSPGHGRAGAIEETEDGSHTYLLRHMTSDDEDGGVADDFFEGLELFLPARADEPCCAGEAVVSLGKGGEWPSSVAAGGCLFFFLVMTGFRLRHEAGARRVGMLGHEKVPDERRDSQ